MQTAVYSISQYMGRCGSHIQVYALIDIVQTLARRARVPLVRLLDGSSGGGSVALYLQMGATYIPAMGALTNSIEALSFVPVASALLGPVVGLAAAKAATSHFRWVVLLLYPP